MLYDTTIPGDAKLVYLVLSSHVGGNESAWPSHRRIAEFADIHPSSVKRQLHWLRDHGYVTWRQRVTDDQAQLTNEYVILAGSAPNPAKTGSSPRTPPVQGEPGGSSPGARGGFTVNGGVAQGELRSRVIERSQGSKQPLDRLPATINEDFLTFWAAYPRKVEKVKAQKIFVALVRKRVDPKAVIAGAQRYRDDPNRDDSFTKHPTTWLNGGCWDDEPLPERAEARRDAVRAPSRPAQGLTVSLPIDSGRA